MKTEVIWENDEGFEEGLVRAAKLLEQGETVVFPTETVYGLGAHALMSDATAKIYAAKGRPSDNPLIVHIHAKEMLDSLVSEVPPVAMKLMAAFWPGPLTLVFKKSHVVPLSVTGGLETVAVRMPNHAIALRLLRLSGVPVAAPSANVSGRPSPTKAEHVVADMTGRVSAIVACHDVNYGLESTVLDVTGSVPMLLRPGTITREMIEEVVGLIDLDETLMKQSETLVPKSPGMKYRHYAPDAQVFVVQNTVSAEGLARVVMGFEERGERVRVVEIEDAVELGRQLFHILRESDIMGYSVILIRAVPVDGVGLAVMNRLLKAAEHRVLG
jgi:L-threonylcarbamoyladenylate synthase